MEHITSYFNAEKNESIVFLSIGFLALLISTYFIAKIKEPFYSGMAYSLIAVGVIQIIAAGTIYFRTPKDITRVSQMFQTEKSRLTTEELPRMERVMKNFTIYRWSEIVLLLIGLFMFFFTKEQSLIKGVGLGMFFQFSISLVLDFIAEMRGAEYLNFLKSII